MLSYYTSVPIFSSRSSHVSVSLEFQYVLRTTCPTACLESIKSKQKHNRSIWVLPTSLLALVHTQECSCVMQCVLALPKNTAWKTFYAKFNHFNSHQAPLNAYAHITVHSLWFHSVAHVHMKQTRWFTLLPLTSTYYSVPRICFSFVRLVLIQWLLPDQCNFSCFSLTCVQLPVWERL